MRVAVCRATLIVWQLTVALRGLAVGAVSSRMAQPLTIQRAFPCPRTRRALTETLSLPTLRVGRLQRTVTQSDTLLHT